MEIFWYKQHDMLWNEEHLRIITHTIWLRRRRYVRQAAEFNSLFVIILFYGDGNR